MINGSLVILYSHSHEGELFLGEVEGVIGDGDAMLA